MLWDINIIPNELDNGYLMLPPGVLHMSALGRFGRFTLFSPRVSHSKHLPVFVLCCVLGLGVFVALRFLFPVLQVFGIPYSPRSLDLDDRQGFIASSAMQQKKKPLCNSRTQLLSSETSDALPQNPPLLLHRISKPGYSQALLGCTLRMSINFLGPIFPTSPPSLKAISLVTSAWINSSPSCPHLLLILRPCRPPSNNFEHLSALKLKAQIPRQPPPCGPPPPPAPPDPRSPRPQPPPPLPHSPSVPVPPPDTSSTPISHIVTTTCPSFPHIEVLVPDPTPRSRTPRRDTDPPFPELIPDSHPPWEQRPGVTPVGAPGTTPLRPPWIPADPNEHRDIRDYNPPDTDIAKGKSKGKGKGKGKKGQGQGSGKGKGKPKGKEDRSSTPSPAIFAPAAKGKGKK